MSSLSPPAGVEGEVTVEELAARLGLPVAMLMRRIHAGDLEAECRTGPDGETWWLRAPAVSLPEQEQLWEADAPRAAAVELDAPADADSTAAADAPPSPPTAPTRGEETLIGRVPLRAERIAAPRPDAELAGLGVDARELVAVLLERWERTLEARLHAEYRLHYQGRLNEDSAQRQRLVADLEEARAALARAAEDRDRLLDEHRREIEEQRRLLASRDQMCLDLTGDQGRRRWFGWGRSRPG